ncbi:unnamed protein product, partial [Mesorhabditis spiculigera]
MEPRARFCRGMETTCRSRAHQHFGWMIGGFVTWWYNGVPPPSDATNNGQKGAKPINSMEATKDESTTSKESPPQSATSSKRSGAKSKGSKSNGSSKKKKKKTKLRKGYQRFRTPHQSSKEDARVVKEAMENGGDTDTSRPISDTPSKDVKEAVALVDEAEVSTARGLFDGPPSEMADCPDSEEMRRSANGQPTDKPHDTDHPDAARV